MESNMNRKNTAQTGGAVFSRPIARARLRGLAARAAEVASVKTGNLANRPSSQEGTSGEHSVKRFHSAQVHQVQRQLLGTGHSQTQTQSQTQTLAMRNRAQGSIGARTEAVPQYRGLSRKQQSESAATAGGYMATREATAVTSRGEMHRTASRGALRATSVTPSSPSSRNPQAARQQGMENAQVKSKAHVLPGPQQQAWAQACRPGTQQLSRANSAHGWRTGPSPTLRADSVSGQAGRKSDAVSPAMPRSSRSTRIQASPVGESATYKSQSLRGMSRIPRPAIPALGGDGSEYSRRRMFLDMTRDAEEQLANERAAVNELLNELKMMAKATESLNEEIATARANTEEANGRADKAELQLRSQQAENAVLRQKVDALSEVIYTQTAVCGDGLPSPDRSHGVSTGPMAQQSNGAESDASDCQSEHAHIVSKIGVVHANYTLTQPESEMDPDTRRHLAIVENYLGEASSADAPLSNTVDGMAGRVRQGAEDMLAPPALFSPPHSAMPQQRWKAEQDERAMRRRSTMLFSGLICPSGGSSAIPDSTLEPGAQMGEKAECMRCSQLLETLQVLEIDNDYYREANSKLRGTVTDIVSRHNALVHVVEREHARRMDERASLLARASQLAVRDRAQLEAQQRAEISADSGPAPPSYGVPAF